MITIKEIASRLGLSTTTVSNVIHGKTKEVSAETIARVQKFLEEVEYVPNINARNLAQGQSKIIRSSGWYSKRSISGSGTATTS